MDADPFEDLARAWHGERVEAGLSDPDSAELDVEKWSSSEEDEGAEAGDAAAGGAAGARGDGGAAGAREDGGAPLGRAAHRGRGVTGGDPPPGETKGCEGAAALHPETHAAAAPRRHGAGGYDAGLRDVGRHGFGDGGSSGETKGGGDDSDSHLGGRSYCEDVASLGLRENCTGERDCNSPPPDDPDDPFLCDRDSLAAAHHPYCLRLLAMIRAKQVDLTNEIHKARGDVARARLARHRSEFHPRRTMGIGASCSVRGVRGAWGLLNKTQKRAKRGMLTFHVSLCVCAGVCVCVCVCVCGRTWPAGCSLPRGF